MCPVLFYDFSVWGALNRFYMEQAGRLILPYGPFLFCFPSSSEFFLLPLPLRNSGPVLLKAEWSHDCLNSSNSARPGSDSPIEIWEECRSMHRVSLNQTKSLWFSFVGLEGGTPAWVREYQVVTTLVPIRSDQHSFLSLAVGQAAACTQLTLQRVTTGHRSLLVSLKKQVMGRHGDCETVSSQAS